VSSPTWTARPSNRDHRIYPGTWLCSSRVDPPRKPEIRATYARIAESFAATRRKPWPQVAEFLQEWPTGSRVADIGCGNGRNLRVAASLGHRALGFDFSRDLLRIGHSSSAEWSLMDWVEAEATALPLRDRCMDACLCIAVLHHLPTRTDRIALLMEIRRILVPHGRALVSVWDVDQPRFRGVSRDSNRDVNVPWTLPGGVRIPRYYHLSSQEEFEGLIIESGLHGERFFKASGNLFGRVSTHG